MGRKAIRAAGIVAIFFLFTTGAGADEGGLANEAKAFVERMTERAIADLTDSAVPVAEQEARFSAIAEEYIATRSIARWVLGGRYWNAASDEQRERYLSLFDDLMAATYAHRFQRYSGETLKIEESKALSDDEALVTTSLDRPGADKAVRIDWRVRRTGDNHRIIDIMVEGLSMAQTQRSEFNSLLRANGGDIEALCRELETRLAKARAEREADSKVAAGKS